MTSKLQQIATLLGIEESYFFLLQQSKKEKAALVLEQTYRLLAHVYKVPVEDYKKE